MEDKRPNPDDLLRQLSAEESTEKHGRLKIFFGYAAGVGKTYTMLSAAHDAQQAGQDVWIGYIEPHTRPDTLALLDGLAEIPPMEISYRGITLRELDLDAVLAKKPGLVLVDELAHSNADGCRHSKRYQDVQELLKAGIDVYTTVNVQHIESLNDIVSALSGVKVQERIPDSVFDSADQVELVDIEPDDLIERLNEGKIYKPQQAQKALTGFFTRENLVSLREIALRRTADRVNRIADKERQLRAETPEYYTDEHILVCLSSSPSNAKVIRTAARMAAAFHANFTALFVETPNTNELSPKNINRLRDNLKLAEQLGARITTVYGDNVAQQIAEFAAAAGISKIVTWRSNNKRHFFSKASLSEQLAAYTQNLDIYIIPDNLPAYTPEKTAASRQFKVHPPNGKDILKTIGILAIIVVAALGFQHIGVTEENIFTLFILGVIVTSFTTGGYLLSILSSFASIGIFIYFFTRPHFNFTSYNPGYSISFAIMLAAAVITSTLAIRVRQQTTQAVMQSARTESLLETSQQLQQAQGEQEIYNVAGHQLLQLLNRPVVIYPGETDECKLKPPLIYAHAKEDVAPLLAPDEQAVAMWAFKNNKHAGATTNTLPGSKFLYLALRSSNKVFGVIGVLMENYPELEVFQKSVLLAMLNELALAVGQEQLNTIQRETMLQVQQEKLRTNILRTISHDLRTPLTSISGNASTLIENSAVLDEPKKQSIYKDIYDDSFWLINLIENLLSVTRIENDNMALQTQPELISEIIEEALQHLHPRNPNHTITTNIPDDMLIAQMDSRLIGQVLVNLVGNALKYTPVGSHITISSYKKDDRFAAISIADDGPGVDDTEKSHLFEMFYTADNKIRDGRRGMGLGLPLCKSIISAHGGTIEVTNNQPSGVVVSFTLPLQEVPPSHA